MTPEQRIEAALAAGRKALEQMALELDAVEAALHGEATPAQQVNRLFKSWGLQWQTKYRAVYVFTARAKAGATFKQLLRSMSVEDIEARMAAYLASQDRFYMDARHSLDLFVKAINKFSGTPVDDAAFLTSPVVNCSHRPRCASDQEHTRKRSQEMRA